MVELHSLEPIWEESVGVPSICVAVLDGPVDQSHPCFDGANLTQLPTLVSGVNDKGSATQHGTHVSSIIFAQQGSSIRGIAPHCRGLVVPIFSDGTNGRVAPCSQMDLARAITQAVEHGANIINISGGQLATSTDSDRFLANAIRLCQEANVLIVAAVGNDGCDCFHVPAALESVLAVGAMDAHRKPIEFSNWGEAYQNQGILALGENILGAIPGGGAAQKSGTSFATPIVSGIVALFLSIQMQRGEKPDPHAIRDYILQSALPCNQLTSLDSRRCLVGTLNIHGAYALIPKGGFNQVSNQKPDEVMLQSGDAVIPIKQLQPSEIVSVSLEQQAPRCSVIGVQAAGANISIPTAISTGANPMSVTPSNATTPNVTPSGAAGDCGCEGVGPMQIVYALGELGTDYGTEARQDSFTQAIPPNIDLLDYLNQNPWEAQSLVWTLNLDATPIYAIVPSGPFASIVYDRLREYAADTSVEKVSIPGYIGGNVRLMSGQVVPVIIPEIRGMYSWSVSALVSSVTAMSAPPSTVTLDQLSSRIEDYVNRVYYDYRNLGITPQERALNFSATNAFQASTAIAAAGVDERVLDTISVEKSPICRPDSDCYDVKLCFFDPENNLRSKRVYRFTIDVSDLIPVTIGEVRSWSQS